MIKKEKNNKIGRYGISNVGEVRKGWEMNMMWHWCIQRDKFGRGDYYRSRSSKRKCKHKR